MLWTNVRYNRAWEIAIYRNASLWGARRGGGVGGDVGGGSGRPPAASPLPIKGLKGLVNAC